MTHVVGLDDVRTLHIEGAPPGGKFPSTRQSDAVRDAKLLSPILEGGTQSFEASTNNSRE